MMIFNPKNLALIFNIVGFQLVWFLCVYGAANGNIIPGLIAAVVFGLAVSRLSPHRKRDLITLSLALPIGFIMDSLLAKSGLITFSHALPSENWAPIWILGLWLGFSYTLNHSLHSIYAKPFFIFLFGFFGAPLAYSIAAYKFGAMAFNGDVLMALIAIACVWGFGLLVLRTINAWLSPMKEVSA
ncbi:MAG: DUF2878 domain-containing protein [Candidatus Methylopumilus sp.]|nr:DUF2878 domain-containing protein [Candidatus Methylopumilus sp.]